jgi:hypothetical protein
MKRCEYYEMHFPYQWNGHYWVKGMNIIITNHWLSGCNTITLMCGGSLVRALSGILREGGQGTDALVLL